MTWTMRQLKGDEVLARDGHVGTLDDVYFDDEAWAVRYLVVNTGNWVAGHRMLVSPQAVEAELSRPGRLRGRVRVAVTREALRAAPDADTEPPVAEQRRIAHAKAFGPPYYWSDAGLWGGEGRSPEHMDPHLRSGVELVGYEVRAGGAHAGRVIDVCIDEQRWAVLELVVDTARWRPGGLVHVRPEDVDRIDVEARQVFLKKGSRDLL